MFDLAIWPAPILQKKTEPVTVFDEELKFFLEQMFETMRAEKGIGLAAPQVGLDRRMLVMDCKTKMGEDNPKVLVNPVITSKSEKLVKTDEGCLSFPGFLVSVERSESVNFDYQTLDGHWVRNFHLHGLQSRCIQHEIDHLDGITFLRYISRTHRNMIKNSLERRYG